MRMSAKKLLLAGTALVVASTCAAGQAQAQNFTLGADAIWASSAGATGVDIQNATEGQTVNVSGFTLTVRDGANAPGDTPMSPADGGTAGAFVLGAVTDTTANGDLVFLQSTGALTGTVASVQVGDNFTVSGADTGNAVNVTVTGAATVGDVFTVSNAGNTGPGDDVNLLIGGALTVTNATNITGGTFGAGGATSAVQVDGNATFGGLVTITGGAGNAANTATLVLRGATNAFNAGALLDTNTGVAQLQVDGTVAQTVSGNILSNGGSEGVLIIGNTSTTGAVFSGDLGSIGAAGNNLAAISLTSTGANTNATFQGFVDATAITLGDGAGTDVNTLTFSSTGNRTVTGTVDGAGAGTDTAAVVVSGGGTLTQTGIWGGGVALDSISITGTGSKLDSDAAITATAITVGAGATLDAGAGLITAPVANSGTIQVTAGGGITGAITGTGLLDVDFGTTITGAITQGTANIAAVTLTQGAASGYTVGTTTFSGAGTLALFNGSQTITGNFTNTTDGQGTITVADGAGTTAFVGDLGASTSNSLAALNILGAGTAQTVTTTGSLFVDTISLTNAADVLQFLGSTTQTVSGRVNGTGGNAGDLVFGSGTTNTSVVFTDFVGTAGATLSDATVNTLASVEFRSAATFAGNLTNDGTVTVKAGHTLAVGGVLAGGGGSGTYEIGIDRTGLAVAAPTVVGTNTAVITNGGANFDFSNDTLTLVVEGGTLINETLDNVVTGVAVAPTITDTVLINFTGAVDGGNNLDVTVAVNSLTGLTSTESNATVANVLINDPVITASTDATVVALRNNLQNATSLVEFNNVLEQAQPTLDGSSFTTAVNVVNSSFDIVSDRLAMNRLGDDVTGMTTGNIAQGVRVWTQAFGATGEQDSRDNIDGYDFDTYGVAVGIDSENIGDNTTLGVAFSYADTEADSDNGAQTNTEIDSYQFTVYGDHDFENDVFLNGMAAYTLNQIDTTRLVAGARALGDYDADQFTVRAEVGRDYSIQGATVSPHVLGHWTHFSPDSYTETGAGGAGLVVTPDDLDIVELGVGVDVNWLFQNSDGSYLSPEISIGYRHDFADDQIEASSRFIAGGQAFSTQGFDPQQDSLDAGVGFTYYSTDSWELSAEYDYEWKEDFQAHAGMVRAAYRY